VTTEKDAARMGPLLQKASGLASLAVVPVVCEISDRAAITAVIMAALAHRLTQRPT
jgi:hypothetical protein